jgi:lysophospholipid acyltransferase (LPLAT)-like uncharacterized protein
MTESLSSPAELRWHQRVVLTLLALLMRAWGRTLRFNLSDDAQAMVDREDAPSVVILWHNRLFAAPVFYRRYFRHRRLATLISSSQDGAWLAGFLRKLGMRPIRGSRYKRGSQAVRDLIEAQNDGWDVGITPDGSRGPMYDMKPGAVMVALKTGAPILLLSLNYSAAWRLRSWDRFFIPVPFSRVDVITNSVGIASNLSDDPEEAAALLKDRLDAMTRD